MWLGLQKSDEVSSLETLKDYKWINGTEVASVRMGMYVKIILKK